MSDSPGRLYRTLRAGAFRLDAERAHELAVSTAARTARIVALANRPPDDPRLSQRLWGLEFPNPVGLAAGYDKRARAIPAWKALGFGFVEVGTITPRPQPGNPRPRVFRLTEHEALVNRLGFNNDGAAATAARLDLLSRRGRLHGVPLGVNIGKGKATPAEDAPRDYADALSLLWPYADYVVVNVSSPNTPGLRDLQESGALAGILAAVAEVNTRRAAEARRPPHPVLVKLAPDLTDEQTDAAVALAREVGVSGLIVCNTTIGRPGVDGHPHAREAGGLSGRPLATRSVAMLRRVAAAAPDLPLVSVGGVWNAADVWERLALGARLVQLWTVLAYRGPTAPGDILRGLLDRMDAEGVGHVGELIGSAR